jgi:hypothetical protein
MTANGTQNQVVTVAKTAPTHTTTRHMAFLLSLVLVLLASASRLWAQTPDVTRFVFNTTNTASLALAADGRALDMSTGTNLLIPQSTNTGGSGSYVFPITYNHFGTNITTFSVNAQGLLGLNATVSEFTTGFSAGTNRLSPLNKAVAASDYMGTSPTGKVHFKVFGTINDRVFVVEFLNMALNANSGNADATFQIRIYERSGMIEYVYGNVNVSSGVPHTYIAGFTGNFPTTSSLASVNFSTNTNTYNTLVNNTVSTTGPIASLNSAANGSRRSYSWVSAGSTVTSLTATYNATAGVNPAGSATLTWTDPSPTNNKAFRVYVSSSASGPYVLLNQTAANAVTFTTQSLTPGTYFFRVVELSEENSGEGASAQASLTVPSGVVLTTTGSGLWSNPLTWSLGRTPISSDSVVIAPTHKIALDINDTITYLTMAGNDTLTYTPATTGLTLTVLADVNVQAGGLLLAPSSGTITTNSLEVYRNLTVNGTLDAAIGTAGFVVRFLGANNGLISGTGSIDFLTASINKIARDTTVTLNLTNPFTVNGSSLNGFLLSTPYTGTLRVAGTTLDTNAIFNAVAYTIPATGGFVLDNPSFVVSGQLGNATLNGRLNIKQGTFNVGRPTALNSFTLAANSITLIEGGLVVTSGRFGVSAAATTINFTITGGEVRTYTFATGTVTETVAGFDLGTSLTSTLNLVGGTINPQRPSNHATATSRLDFRAPHATTTIIPANINYGGTQLVFGNANSPTVVAPAANYFFFAGFLPRATIVPTTGPAFALARSASTLLGNFTIASGSTLWLNGQTVTLAADSIINNGKLRGGGTTTAAAPAGTLQIGYNLTPAPAGLNKVISGTGAVDTIPAFEIFHPAGLKLDASVPNFILMAARFRRGGIVGTVKFTLGNATNPVTIEYGQNSTFGNYNFTAGTFDDVPAFNIGTCPACTLSVNYNPELTARTTGVEIPASRVISKLQLANPKGVNLVGGNLILSGSLPASTVSVTLLRGNNGSGIGSINTGANAIIINNTFAGAIGVGNDSAYINGRLTRTLAAGATGTTDYAFPIGKARFGNFTMVGVTTAAGTSPDIEAEFFQAATGGTAGTGLTDLQDFYWNVAAVTNAAQFTSSNFRVGLGLTSVLSTISRLAYSPTQTGTYSAISAAPVANILNTTGAAGTLGTFALGRFYTTLSGTKTIGPGGDYATFTAAVAAYSTSLITGNVNFEVLNTYDATVVEPAYPVVFTNPNFSASGFRMTFRPQAGANPVVSGTSTSSIFRLNSASNITFNGSNTVGGTTRNWTITNTSTATGTAGIWLSSAGVGQGCTNDSILNLAISCNIITATSVGIIASGTAIGVGSTGADNDNLLIENNWIKKALFGISVAGTSNLSAGAVDNVTIKNNKVGSDVASEYVTTYGVILGGTRNGVVSGNELYNHIYSSTTNGASILLNANVTDINVFNNYIHDANNSNTGGYGFYGIHVSSNTNTNNVNIYNNVLNNLTAIGFTTTSTTDNPFGIRVNGGNNIRVYYNTIRMAGAADFGSGPISAAIMLGTLSPTNVEIVNNILYNEITSVSTVAVRVALWIYGPTIPSVIRNNIYFVAGGPSLVANYSTSTFTNTYYPTLPAYQAAYPGDVNSLNVDPTFNNGPGGNLIPLPGSPASGAGFTLAGYTSDYTGFTRGTPPSIGAYEQAIDALGPAIGHTVLGTGPVAASRLTTATITDGTGVQNTGVDAPRLYFKKLADANTFGANNSATNGWKYVTTTSTSSPYSFTIDYSLLQAPIAVGDDIQYFIIAQDVLGNLSSVPSSGLVATSVSSITTNPTGLYTYRIGGIISGFRTIGPAPSDFVSFTAAAQALRDSVVNGTLELRVLAGYDATYSALIETYPVSMPNPNFVTTGRVVIRPNAGATPTMQMNGTTAAFNAPLRFNNASNYTLDGSNTPGGTTRDFTIRCNNTTINNSAAIWISSNGTGQGSQNDTLRNLNIVGGSITTANNNTHGVFIGGNTLGTTDGGDNDNIVLSNNVITRAAVGIGVRGTAATSNGAVDGLVISNNTIGGTVTTDYVTYTGINLRNVAGASVTKNEVQNVTNTGGNAFAIALGAGVTNGVYSYNYLHDVVSSGGNSSAGVSIGLGAALNINNNVIHNNVINNIGGAGSTNVVTNPWGIRLEAGTNTKVLFNSIRMAGTGAAALSSAPFYANPANLAEVAGLEVYNNVFFNAITGATGYKAYNIYLKASLLPALLRNNDYFGGNTFGFYGADVASLTDWQIALPQDVGSLNIDPGFNSPAIGNLRPVQGNGILNTGFGPAPYPLDYLGLTRGNPPSMGAYEVGADISAPQILYTLLGQSGVLPTRVLNNFANITDPSGLQTTAPNASRFYFKKTTDANTFGANNNTVSGWKYVLASNSTNPYSYTIDYSLLSTALAVGDTIQYFIVAQDLLGNVGSQPSAGFAGTSVSTITSAPTTPPTYRIVPSISGTKTIGPAPSDYLTFKQAADSLLGKVVLGNLTYLVLNGYDAAYSVNEPTFPITFTQPLFEQANGTVTIRPQVGANPVIQTTTANAVFRFTQLSGFVLDGSNTVGGTTRNMTVHNASTLTTATAVWLSSNGVGLGCTRDTVRNLNVIGTGLTSTGQVGICVNGTTISSTATGADNDNIVIQNNWIKKAYTGIAANGTTATSAGGLNGLVIRGNKIGGDVASEYIGFYGIYLSNNIGASVDNNEVYNMITSTLTNFSGIFIGTGSQDLSIYNNYIHDFNNTNTGGWGAYGISLSTPTNVSNVQIYNNVLNNITAIGFTSTSTTDNPFGIRLAGGTNVKVYHNSIRMAGAADYTSGPMAGAIYVNTTMAGLEIVNNVLVNEITSTATAFRRMALITPGATSVGLVRNNLYFTNGGAILNGTAGGTNYANLAAYQAVFTGDVGSISALPQFNNGPGGNLRPLPGSPVLGAGFTNTVVTVDNLGVTRGTPPTMGAYEIGIDGAGPAITYTPLGNTILAPTRVLNNFATMVDISAIASGVDAPRIYYKKTTEANAFVGNTSADNGWKYVSATNGASPFSFTMDFSILNTPLAVGDQIEYFVTAQDVIGNISANPSSGFAALAVSNVTTAPTNTNKFFIAGVLSGTKTIGPGGDYLTFTAAIAALNSNIISGNLELQVLNTYSASYAQTAEASFPLTFPQPSYLTTGRVLIHPAPGANPVVQANSTTSVFRFQDVSTYTLDGSNVLGGTSRNWTITNTGTTANSAAIWFASNGAGNNGDTIRNLNIVGPNTTVGTIRFGVFIGGTTLSSTGTGANNDNIAVLNNAISRSYYGVYASGSTAVSATGALDGLAINGNLIGSTTVSDYVYPIGIWVGNAVGVQIIRNEVFNVIHATGTNNGVITISGGVSNATISYNHLHDIDHQSASGWGEYGIFVTAGTDISIHHNLINNLTSFGYNFTTNDNAHGIVIGGSTNVKVYYNTIRLAGASLNTTGGLYSGIFVTSTAVTGLEIVNNLISNEITSASPITRYTMAFAVTGTAPAVMRNNLYFNNASTPFALNGTAVATFVDWQAAFPGDLGSLNVSPVFNQPASQSLVPFLGSPVVGAGFNLAPGFVVTDYIGVTRGTPPSIGAYEQARSAIPPFIQYSLLGNSVVVPNRLLTNFATITDVQGGVDVGVNKPRLYYKKSTEANIFGANLSSANGWKYVETTSSTSPFSFDMDFTLLNSPLAVGNNIQYFVSAQDSLGALGANPSIGFSGTSVTALTTAPTTPNSFLIGFPLSGQIDVPIPGGGAFTLPSITNVAGVFDTLNKSVIGGPIVINITDSLVESGLIALGRLAYTGASQWPISMRTNAGDTMVISSSNPGGLIRFESASNVKVDGGVDSRLLFVNTSVDGAVFSFTQDAAFDTLQNLIIQGSNSNVAQGLVFVGSGTTAGNHDLLFSNLRVSNIPGVTTLPANLIYSQGLSSTVKNYNVTLTNSKLYNFSASGFFASNANTGNGNKFVATNNNVYHNAAPALTAQTAIRIEATGGSGHIVSNNFVGGNDTSATGFWVNGATGITANSLIVAVVGVGNQEVLIQNNVIRNFVFTGTGTGITYQALTVAGSSPFTVTNNLIGDSAQTSFQLAASTGAPIGFFSNVNIIGTDTGRVNFSNNEIAFLQNDAASNLNAVYHPGTGGFSATNNKIHDLYSAGTGTFTVPSIVGFRLQTTSRLLTNRLQSNKLYNFTNTSTTGGGHITGITFVSAGRMQFDGNFIHSFFSNTTSTTANHTGSYYTSGFPIFTNNVIYLQNQQAAATTVALYGLRSAVFSTVDTEYVVNNTLYLSGLQSGTVNSAAYYRSSTGAARLRNNLFHSARTSSGTGRMLAMWIASTTNFNAAGVSNYNYVKAADSLFTCFYNGTATSFASYAAASLNDANSYKNFNAVYTDIANLNLELADTLDNCQLKEGGIYNIWAPRDFASAVRPVRWPDVGAHQFDLTKPRPVVSVTITHAPTLLCAGDPVTFTAVRNNFLLGVSSIGWVKNGVVIPGAIDTFYVATGLVTGDRIAAVLRSGYINGCAVNSIDTSNVDTMFFNATSGSVSISTTSNDTICAGTSVTFKALPVNLGTSPTYTWKLNGATVGTNDTVFTTTALASGDSVWVEVVSNNPCFVATRNSDTLKFFVNPVLTPTATVTPSIATAFCAGTYVKFTATSANVGTAPTYAWTVNSIPVTSTVDTFGSAALQNGDVISVTVTSDGSVPCLTSVSATGSATVTVNPILTASVSVANVPNACLGDTLTFNATPTNGGTNPTYQWFVNGQAAGSNNAIFTTNTLLPGDSISVQVTADPALPCVIGSPASSAFVKPFIGTPPTGVAITLPDSIEISTQLTAVAIADQGTATFTWNFGNNATPQTVTGATVNTTYGQLGWQLITLTVVNQGCSVTVTDSVRVYQVNTSTGPLVTVGELQVYPNPTAANFFIEFTQPTAAAFLVEIVNNAGQVIFTQNVAATQNYRESFDLSEYSAGSYYVKLHTNAGTMTRKVVRQ